MVAADGAKPLMLPTIEVEPIELDAAARAALAPDSFDWRREPYEFESSRLAIELLLGMPGLRERVEDGASLASMEASYRRGLRAFVKLRRRFLVYGD